MKALVLAGGNALGSYLGGAYQALHEAEEEPDWIAGTSIGAITGGIIAGNPPERRLSRLREFWTGISGPNWLPWPRGASWMNALQTRLAGRPAFFHTHFSFLSRLPHRVGLYDTDPMRRMLETLIDFDMLNAGRTRLSILAVDLQTGEEVAFDTTRERISVDHLLASAALIPDFPPVRIGERWLIDGGMAANLPIDLVLRDPVSQDLVCYLVDLFPIDAPLPDDLSGMAMRQSDLTFACQTERSLRAWADRFAARPEQRQRVDLVRTSYAGDPAETAMKSWDYSEAARSRRWTAGCRDMQAALQEFRAGAAGKPGLHVHRMLRAAA